VVNDNKQVVQPEVSKSKFATEVNEFRQLEDEWRKKGIICLKIAYPKIQLAFAAHQLRPAPIVFAVSLDFTNYDLEPPSIKFIDPLNGNFITTKEMQVNFYQVINSMPQIPIPGMPPMQFKHPQVILMGAPNDQPFLCIPGVREYHEHPAHTGDSWFLHRTQGEGKLGFLIDQLYNHSIPFVRGYNVNFNVSINQQV
jgi:hypothetical protein